jgi:hypothetical protein
MVRITTILRKENEARQLLLFRMLKIVDDVREVLYNQNNSGAKPLPSGRIILMLWINGAAFDA